MAGESHTSGGPSRSGVRRRRRSWRDLAREFVVWLFIPVTVHTAVIVLLMNVHGCAAPTARKEAVIDTAFEEIDIRDRPVEHLAPTNIKTSAVSDKRLDWRELIKPDATEVEGPDERNILKMLEATEDEPLVMRKVSVPVDGLTAIPRLGGAHESKSSVAAVVDALGREVGKILTKRNVLLVWVFDESLSMRVRQREVRGRITKLYGELQGATPPGRNAKLVSAVVGYGQKTDFFLMEPSGDPAQVQAAIDRVPPDMQGRENVMAACRDVERKYRQYARAQRRILVIFIVTDEEGDDTQHLEDVLATMDRGGIRVFVLGSEARFQQRYLFPRHPSPQAPASVLSLPDDDARRRQWLVPATVEAGPECAWPETLYGHELESAWYGWKGMSGFGFWALSRLAGKTGGVYYVLHGEKGPTYDPEVMKPYAPELCTRQEYIERCKADRIRGTIHRLHELLSEVPFAWPDPSVVPERFHRLMDEVPYHGRIYPDRIREGLSLARRMAQRRLERLDEIIRVLESGTLANAPHAPRRWEANRQLALADCYALRWSARQYLLALEAFERKPELDSRAEYYSVGTGSYSEPAPLRGGKPAEEDRRAARAKYEQVMTDHPGTPWAECAQRRQRFDTYWVQPYIPSRDRPTPQAPPPPNV